MTEKTCVILGFGPGLGQAYANAFSESGYRLALLSRTAKSPSASNMDHIAIECDAANPASVQSALNDVEERLGPIDVLIYNADLAQFGPLEEIDETIFEASWKVGALGLFAAAKHITPGMAERGQGTIIVSGATAALRGNVWTTAFAPTKAAQRILAQSLAKQLGPKGIHVAYIVIDGVIDTEDTRANFAPDRPDDFFVKPAAIAQAALHLAAQDRSAWTFELDLRPFGERW